MQHHAFYLLLSPSPCPFSLSSSTVSLGAWEGRRGTLSPPLGAGGGGGGASLSLLGVPQGKEVVTPPGRRPLHSLWRREEGEAGGGGSLPPHCLSLSSTTHLWASLGVDALSLLGHSHSARLEEGGGFWETLCLLLGGVPLFILYSQGRRGEFRSLPPSGRILHCRGERRRVHSLLLFLLFYAWEEGILLTCWGGSGCPLYHCHLLLPPQISSPPGRKSYSLCILHGFFLLPCLCPACCIFTLPCLSPPLWAFLLPGRRGRLSSHLCLFRPLSASCLPLLPSLPLPLWATVHPLSPPFSMPWMPTPPLTLGGSWEEMPSWVLKTWGFQLISHLSPLLLSLYTSTLLSHLPHCPHPTGFWFTLLLFSWVLTMPALFAPPSLFSLDWEDKPMLGCCLSLGGLTPLSLACSQTSHLLVPFLCSSGFMHYNTDFLTPASLLILDSSLIVLFALHWILYISTSPIPYNTNAYMYIYWIFYIWVHTIYFLLSFLSP